MRKQELHCSSCQEYIGIGYMKGQPEAFCSTTCKKKVDTKLRREVRKQTKREIQRPKRLAPPENFDSFGLNLSPMNKGAVGELMAAAVLLSRGYEVFRSVSPNARCDLVIIKGRKTFKVEVRTGKLSNGSFHFPRKDSDNADFYAVYHRKDNQPMVALIKNKWQ